MMARAQQKNSPKTQPRQTARHQANPRAPCVRRKDKPTEKEMRLEFWEAHDKTRFSPPVIAAVRGCTTAQLEKERANNFGPPYIKSGEEKNARVTYEKGALLRWWDEQNEKAQAAIRARTIVAQAHAQERSFRGTEERLNRNALDQGRHQPGRGR